MDTLDNNIGIGEEGKEAIEQGGRKSRDDALANDCGPRDVIINN